MNSKIAKEPASPESSEYALYYAQLLMETGRHAAALAHINEMEKVGNGVDQIVCILLFEALLTKLSQCVLCRIFLIVKECELCKQSVKYVNIVIAALF